MFEIIILSIVQGITEFLPISSSAHLILVSKYFNFNNSNLTLDMSLHLGSLVAIIIYFFDDMRDFVKNRELLKKIIISSIPLTIVGFFLIKFNYIDFLRSYKVIGWSSILFGFILYLSDLRNNNKTIKKDLNYSSIIFIGFFQILALIPGASRSGIVITSARLLNYNRVDSAKISFLTAIPILILVSIFNIKEIIIQNTFEISIFNFAGVTLSFIFSFLTIKLFISFLNKFNLIIFVVYRIIIGITILIYVYQ